MSTADEKLSGGVGDGQWREQKGLGMWGQRKKDCRELGSDAFILLIEKLISKMLRSLVQE